LIHFAFYFVDQRSEIRDQRSEIRDQNQRYKVTHKHLPAEA